MSTGRDQRPHRKTALKAGDNAMHLSPELAVSNKEATSVCRRSQRIAIDTAVAIIDDKTGEPLQKGATIDFSPYGVRIQDGMSSLTVGQMVQVVLRGQINCNIRSVVVWVGSLESRRLGQVGLEFLIPQIS